MVGCRCGETLLVPSMLQVKALPVAVEKPVPPREKTSTSSRIPLATSIFGIVCVALAIPIGWLEWFWGFNDNFVSRACLTAGSAFLTITTLTVLGSNFSYRAILATFVFGIANLLLFISLCLWGGYAYFPYGGILLIVCFGLGCGFTVTAIALALRVRFRPDDNNILSRTFFILGTVLLFPAFWLVLYLYLWTPDPLHALYKRTQFSFGSNQRMLPQDSTPIPMEERTILWMKDEYIDQMMPMELYLFFQTLEKPTFSYNFLENYEAVWATHRIWVTVNIVMFILAFTSIVVSFFMPKHNVVVTGWSGSEW